MEMAWAVGRTPHPTSVVAAPLETAAVDNSSAPSVAVRDIPYDSSVAAVPDIQQRETAAAVEETPHTACMAPAGIRRDPHPSHCVHVVGTRHHTHHVVHP